MRKFTRNPCATLAASLALVAALALSACAAGTTSAPQSARPSATTPSPSAWTAVSGAALAQAPGAIRTTYRTSDGAHRAIQRSDDAGASWRTLPWPRIAGAHLPADVVNAGGSWNTRAPDTLFVSMDLANDAACPATSVIPISTDYGANSPISSTGTLCALTYVTGDNGASWRALTFHGGASWTMAGFLDFDTSSSNGAPVAQGSRLFALFTPTQAQENLSTRENGLPPTHLFASDDGGASWRQADASMTTAGEQVLGVFAAPAGQTLIALTQPRNTPSRQVPTAYHIWTSQDSGATWTKASATPGGRVDSMVVAYPAIGAPVLYLLGYNNEQADDLNLYASDDGGHTWPYTLDLHQEDVGPSESPWLLGALPDGGAAIFDNAGLGVAPPPAPPTTNMGALSEWRYDMTSARTLTAYSNITNLSVVTIEPAAGGATIWLSGFNGGGQSVIEYATMP